MASSYSIFLLILVFILGVNAQKISHSLINPGSSLSPKTNLSWPSSSGKFAFGFYQQGNGFSVGVWFVGAENTSIIVWTANRDDPSVGSTSTLNLTTDGRLVLTTEEGGDKYVANLTDNAPVAFASMLDSGNFVLYNKELDVIWGSFDHPTDTILGGQILPSGGELISSLSSTDHVTGRFHIKMQLDGNLVSHPLNVEDSPTTAYWDSRTFNSSGDEYQLLLNYTGHLDIVSRNGSSVKSVLSRVTSTNNDNYNNSNNPIYRATLDDDGILRLYSHTYEKNGKLKSSLESSVLENTCLVKGFCGCNSFCTLNDNEPYCPCLPGTVFLDPNQKWLGCGRNFSQAECKDGKDNAALYNLTIMENIKWDDHPYFKSKKSIEECSNSCLEDCNCEVAIFQQGFCSKHYLPLRYIRRDSTNPNDRAFFKVRIITGNRTDSFTEKPVSMTTVINKRSIMLIPVLITLIVLLVMALILSGIFIYKFRVLKYKSLLETRILGLGTEELNLRLFSYNDLKRATNGFKEELGKGSFGAVYKGTLYEGKKLIAVKRLEKIVEEGEREFQAEIRAIGRAHHRNLVRLLGYCAEGSKRLLVYEYMANGSLADLLFKAVRRPDWDERARIAMDVARGILYLHEECEAPTIHCDIKPQNILMDDFWTAKISDFGLAKLLMPDQTRTFTIIRGTRGYLAPEWHKNTPITPKVDVYSYGIVLLEIICCRKNFDVNMADPEEIVLSSWVYKCFVAGDLHKIVIGEEVDKKSLENMVKVGLWCIQDEPALRPSMKSVVLMLQGITDIAIPPCPTSATIRTGSASFHEECCVDGAGDY